MKHRWLLCSLLFLFAVYFEGAQFYFLLGLIGLYWFLRYRDRTVFIVVLLAFCFLFVLQLDPSLPKGNSYRVEVVKPYYLLLKNGHSLYYAERIEGASYDDIYTLETTLSELKEDSSFYSRSIKKIYASQQVYYQLNILSAEKVREGSSIRRSIWNKIQEVDNEEVRLFLNQVLFQYDDNDLFSNFDSFLNSSGIPLSSICYLLRKAVGFVFYPQLSSVLFFILLFAYGSLTHFSCTLYRLLLSELLSFVEEQDDALGLLILGLLLINPDYRNSLAFQLPIYIRFVSLYKKDRQRFDSFFISIPVQLAFNYRFSLFSSLLFTLYRSAYPLLCLLLLILLYARGVFLLQCFMEFIKMADALFLNWYLSGKPGLWLVALYTWVLVDYFQKRKKSRIALMAVLLVGNQYQSFFHFTDRSVFLNVRHGDCYIYQSSFSNSVFMIDTGSTYNYSRLKNYLNARGIRTIDKLIVTHDDGDHNGNVEALKKDYRVKEIISEKQDRIIYKGKEWVGLLQEKSYASENDNSQIYLSRIHGLNYLFCGDISKEVEEDLVDTYPQLKVDILKSAHHGSNTSNSFPFLSVLYPKLVIISCGDNIYHFPSEETIQTLQALKIPYLCTKDEGDMEILSFGKWNILFTSTHLLQQIR